MERRVDMRTVVKTHRYVRDIIGRHISRNCRSPCQLRCTVPRIDAATRISLRNIYNLHSDSLTAAHTRTGLTIRVNEYPQAGTGSVDRQNNSASLKTGDGHVHARHYTAFCLDCRPENSFAEHPAAGPYPDRGSTRWPRYRNHIPDVRLQKTCVCRVQQ